MSTPLEHEEHHTHQLRQNRYLDNKNYAEALTLISSLLRELKRLDDKNVLMEVQLLESRVYLSLRNLAKSRVGWMTTKRVQTYTLDSHYGYIGSTDIGTNIRQLHLLPTAYASRFGHAVWHLARGGERLQNSVCTNSAFIKGYRYSYPHHPDSHTSTKPSKTTPPRTTAEQSLPSNTCFSAKSCSTSRKMYTPLSMVNWRFGMLGARWTR